MFSNNTGDAKEIFAIKSWGNVGLVYNYMDGFLLEYIAVPNENSFTRLDVFSLTDMPIQEIPDYLFKSCNKLEQVDLKECPNLKYIPEHLFEGVDDISAITKEFPEGLEVPAGW